MQKEVTLSWGIFPAVLSWRMSRGVLEISYHLQKKGTLVFYLIFLLSVVGVLWNKKGETVPGGIDWEKY